MDSNAVERDAGQRFDPRLKNVRQAGVVLARGGTRLGHLTLGDGPRIVVERFSQLALGHDARAVVHGLSQLALGYDARVTVQRLSQAGLAGRRGPMADAAPRGFGNWLGASADRSLLDGGFRLVLHRSSSQGLEPAWR